MSTNTSGAKLSSGGISGSLTTLYERRWLAWYFIQRDLTRRYRGSLLGLAWLVISPLLTVALYTLVFSQILGLRFQEAQGVANFGLYLYCGLLPYQAFADTLGKAARSIKSNTTLVQRVVFPLEILPLSTALTSLMTQFFGVGALLGLTVILEQQLQWTLLLLPIIVVPQLLFILGLGYLTAIAGAYLPDLKDTLNAVTRALFFVTPIIWDADRVPEDSPLRPLIDYNPLAYLVEVYRDLILEGVVPGARGLLIFTLFATVLMFAGYALFVRVKRQFADLL